MLTKMLTTQRPWMVGGRSRSATRLRALGDTAVAVVRRNPHSHRRSKRVPISSGSRVPHLGPMESGTDLMAGFAHA